MRKNQPNKFELQKQDSWHLKVNNIRSLTGEEFIRIARWLSETGNLKEKKTPKFNAHLTTEISKRNMLN